MALMPTGCGSQKPTAPPAPPNSSTAAQQVSYSGGDGSNLERAIVITGAKGEEEGIKAEYDWLRAHYPVYRLLRQGLRSVNGRAYDQLDIRTPQGEKPVFFEITSFYGK